MSDSSKTQAITVQLDGLQSRFEKTESTIVEVGKAVARLETKQDNVDRALTRLAEITEKYQDKTEGRVSSLTSKIHTIEKDQENQKGRWWGIAASGAAGGGIGALISKLFGGGTP